MLAVARERILELEEEVRRLEAELDSRAVIERAKGVLSERLAIGVDHVFEILRHAARSGRLSVREVAGRVVEEPWTPAPVVVALAREQRFRAAGMRELAEAHRASVEHLREQLDSVNRAIQLDRNVLQ